MDKTKVPNSTNKLKNSNPGVDVASMVGELRLELVEEELILSEIIVSYLTIKLEFKNKRKSY